MPASALQLAGQAVIYAGFAAFIGYFASHPAYTHMDPSAAAVTLSFGHAGARKEACRRLTPEEIAALPANMRRPLDCPRERVALLVELEIDGEPLYHALRRPSGLAGDGASTVYERFVIPPGRHRITARLRDTPREEGFDYTLDEIVELAPGEHLVIDFRAESGGFRLL